MPYVDIFLTIASPLLALEMVLYHAAPRLLARLAFIPIGTPRTVQVSRRWLDERQVEAAYRSPARQALSLDQFPLLRDLTGPHSLGRWEGDSGWLREKIRFGEKSSLGVVSLRARLEGDHVHLAARAFPVPFTIPLMAPLLMVPHFFPFMLVFLVGIGVSWMMSIRRLRGDADAALTRIAGAIEEPRRAVNQDRAEIIEPDRPVATAGADRSGPQRANAPPKTWPAPSRLRSSQPR